MNHIFLTSQIVHTHSYCCISKTDTHIKVKDLLMNVKWKHSLACKKCLRNIRFYENKGKRDTYVINDVKICFYCKAVYIVYCYHVYFTHNYT